MPVDCRRFRTRRLAGVVAVLLCAAWPALASERPATPDDRPRSGRFDGAPVRVSGGDAARPDLPESTALPPTTQSAADARLAGATAGGVSTPSLKFDWVRVALSLGVVLALIVALRGALRRWLGASATSGLGRGVRVVGRTVLGPRQQVVLLQVGSRVIVAADNAGQLAPLAQITDADEVASLLGQLNDVPSSAKASTGGFSRWFGRARDDFGDDEIEPQAVGPAGFTANRAGAEPSVESARGELAGLMEKVRGLAQQFRRGDSA